MLDMLAGVKQLLFVHEFSMFPIPGCGFLIHLSFIFFLLDKILFLQKKKNSYVF